MPDFAPTRVFIRLLALTLVIPAYVYSQKSDDELQRLVHTESPDLRGLAAIIGPRGVPAMTEALRDPDPKVRVRAAIILGFIGRSAQPAEPALLRALKDEDPDVRRAATFALFYIGPRTQAAVRALAEALRDDGFDNQYFRVKALLQVAQALQDARQVDAIDDLQKAENELQNLGFDEEAADVRRAVEHLKLLRPTVTSQIFTWAGQHLWLTALLLLAPFYLLWFVMLRFVILPRAPLRLLAWNEALTTPSGPAELEVSGSGPKIKLPLRSLLKDALLIGRYHYHPRVLEAWVEERVAAARTGFGNLETAEQRKTFVPLPVALNRKSVSALGPEHLRDTTSRDRWCVVVKGEGGLGKTALACQLALWAMAEDPAKRLCEDRRMLPVMLEPDVKFDVRSDVPTFQTELRGKLGKLIGTKDPIPDGFFQQLLRDRRVLVILDGLSEMLDAPSRPGAARLENPDFPVNALVVTSRRDEKLGEDLIIEPQRIDSTHLVGFINSYLAEAGQTGLSDAELFDASRRLADLVTMEAGITPLLARLFAEQLVDLEKRKEPAAKLPRSVPDLMLAYINVLNRDRSEGDPDDAALHRAAKIAAWECVRATLRPGQPGSKEAIREALACAQLDEALLERLERLRIVKTDEPAKTHVRFELDPLSEYLAALKLCDDCAQNPECWRAFLEEANGKPGSPETIRGFLLAVRDCCEARATDCPVPEFVADELAKGLGLDPDAIADAHEQRYIERLIRHLRSPEPADREYGAEKLGEIGWVAAEAAVPALIEALADKYAIVRRAAAYALGEIGWVAKKAVVPALTQALEDPEPYVQQTASAALIRARRVSLGRRSKRW